MAQIAGVILTGAALAVGIGQVTPLLPFDSVWSPVNADQPLLLAFS